MPPTVSEKAPLEATVTLRRITMINGSAEFCEEFFDEVELPNDAVVGGVGKGWQVASRQMFHERRSMGDGSEYTSGPGISEAEDVSVDLLSLVERTNQECSERVREMIGRALVHRTVQGQLSEHVFHAVEQQRGSLRAHIGSEQDFFDLARDVCAELFFA